jgi:hypothetical protein
MIALARASGAPRLDRAEAARALGGDPAQLDRALAGDAQGAYSQPYVDSTTWLPQWLPRQEPENRTSH